MPLGHLSSFCFWVLCMLLSAISRELSSQFMIYSFKTSLGFLFFHLVFGYHRVSLNHVCYLLAISKNFWLLLQFTTLGYLNF